MDDRFTTVEQGFGTASGGPPTRSLVDRAVVAGAVGDSAGSLKRLALAAAITLWGSAVAVADDPRQPVSYGPAARLTQTQTRPHRLPSTSEAGSDWQSDRQRLARLTSREILQQSPSVGRHAPPEPLADSMTVLRLHRRSEQLTLDAELALRRGAIRSARESVIEALRTSAAAADLQNGRSDATRALEDATTAVREAGDLVGRYGHVGTAELQRMVQSHQTPVLHGCRLDKLTPYAAADIYLDFARESFTRAAAGQRQVAGTLLWLSRTELAHRELHGELAESVAITCLRAAVGVDPNHAMASNELGYRAMRLGLLNEAQWALERSLELQPSAPALQNLIETHRLAGNTQAAQRLVAMLPSVAGEPLSSGPTVLQVDPSQFAAISPPVQPPAMNAASPARELRHPLAPEETGPEPERTPANEEALTESGPAKDGSFSVLERVADSMRSFWN